MKKYTLLALFLVLVVSVPLIKWLLIKTVIININSINIIKTLLIAGFNYLGLTIPHYIINILAETFWPLVITIATDIVYKLRKKKHFLHPAAMSSFLWIILNGSTIFFQAA